MSASRRFLFKLSRRASSNAGHAHASSQRSSARIAAEFDLRLQSWVELGEALLPLGRQLLPEALEPLHGPLVEVDVDAYMPCRFCTSRQQCASSMKRLSMLRRIVGDAHYFRRHPAADAVELV